MTTARAWVAPGALLLATLFAGCLSTVKLSEQTVAQAPPAGARAITITVSACNEDNRGTEGTLLTDLKKEFTARGYRVDGGDLVLNAMITYVEFGNGYLNDRLPGLGPGSDNIDVRIELSNAKGTPYMSFLVSGRALDKRYTDIYQVVGEIAKKIAGVVKDAGR